MNWQIIDNRLSKTYILGGFDEVMKGLEKIRVIANQMNHHPDFEVFDYKYIRFKLYTHDAKSISELDYQLAAQIDAVFE